MHGTYLLMSAVSPSILRISSVLVRSGTPQSFIACRVIPGRLESLCIPVSFIHPAVISHGQQPPPAMYPAYGAQAAFQIAHSGSII